MPYGTATRLNVQAVGRTPVNTTMVAADTTNGNKIAVGGKTVLRAVNTGAQRTITINLARQVDGYNLANPTITVPATTGDVLVNLSAYGTRALQPDTNDIYLTTDGALQLGAFEGVD